MIAGLDERGAALRVALVLALGSAVSLSGWRAFRMRCCWPRMAR